MNSEQLKVIIENLDEIQQGISNQRAKELGIRNFCVRRVRKIEDRKTTLYMLTNEWRDYVNSHLNDSESISTLFDELPNSSSSLIGEPSCRDLARMINRMFIKNETEFDSLFNRVILLRRFFYVLSDRGLTSTEIIEYDLYEILVKFLFHTVEGRYKLIDDSLFHYEYCIYKYYNRGIEKYLCSISASCFESDNVIDFIRIHIASAEHRDEDTNALTDIAKFVQVLIDYIIFSKHTTDRKTIFKYIPVIGYDEISHILKSV